MDAAPRARKAMTQAISVLFELLKNVSGHQYRLDSSNSSFYRGKKPKFGCMRTHR